MAVGLGSIDMPVPSVTEWEWLNWKFPRPVRAGETIYARWTLTQKRAPVGGAPTAIVVWRVDVHTAGGALCAEGEVGASVLRNAATGRPRVEEPVAAAATPAPRRGRRRRRTPAGDGAAKATETKVAVVAEAPIVAATTPPASAERPPSTRRRRRRRSPGSAQARNGDSPAAAAPAAEASSPPAAASAAATAKPEGANTLSRVIRRLRRP